MESLFQLKDLLLSGQLSRPVVFDNAISSWPLSGWNVSNLAYVLGEKTLKFRIGKKHSKDLQWESQCSYENATIPEFLDWLEGSDTTDNPLSAYDRDTYWCYGDYKYMMYLFADQPEFLKAVDWSVFGFEGRDGTQSTMWLGSEGAYTPCHYDTYGCNLVAQIYGRKRWFLFPPDQLKCMYPTRVPYEESSVFSQVNVTCPDLQKHPNFKLTTPYVVTLEPGQVLYVPHQWWHYVQSLDTSLSINSWIELPIDYETRLQEAVTRTLVTTLMAEDTSLPVDVWLNPTEDPYPFQMNMKCVRQSLGMLDSALPHMNKNTRDSEEPTGSCLGEVCSSDKTCIPEETHSCLSNTNISIDKDASLSLEPTKDFVSDSCTEEYQPTSKKTKFEISSSLEEESTTHCVTVFNMKNAAKVQRYSFDDYCNLVDEMMKAHENMPKLDGSLSPTKDNVEIERLKEENLLEKNVDSVENCSKKLSSCDSLVLPVTEPATGSCIKAEVDEEVEQTQVKEVQIDTATLVNCVVHPQVVAQICQLLKENIKLK